MFDFADIKFLSVKFSWGSEPQKTPQPNFCGGPDPWIPMGSAPIHCPKTVMYKYFHNKRHQEWHSSNSANLSDNSSPVHSYGYTILTLMIIQTLQNVLLSMTFCHTYTNRMYLP